MSVEMTPIGRPYAKAAYALAKKKDQLEQWEGWLSAFKPLLQHRPFLDYLLHPHHSKTDQVDALMRWVKSDAGVLRRFLGLLADRNRLVALPAICEQFEALLAGENQLLQLKIVSAFPLSASVVDLLETWLKKKWGAEHIQAEYLVDSALIGGVEISTHDGSRVLRLSMKHQLQQLKQALLG